jgi:hypothetical protein
VFGASWRNFKQVWAAAKTAIDEFRPLSILEMPDFVSNCGVLARHFAQAPAFLW